MFNTITHEKEIPDSAKMLFTKKETIIHDFKTYQIIVKSSSKPLLSLPGHNIYSSMQILDNDHKEVNHEVYTTILSELQAERIITSVKNNIVTWINNTK